MICSVDAKRLVALFFIASTNILTKLVDKLIIYFILTRMWTVSRLIPTLISEPLEPIHIDILALPLTYIDLIYAIIGTSDSSANSTMQTKVNPFWRNRRQFCVTLMASWFTECIGQSHFILQIGFLCRRCYSIGGLFQSIVCLSAALWNCGQTVQERPIVRIEVA